MIEMYMKFMLKREFPMPINLNQKMYGKRNSFYRQEQEIRRQTVNLSVMLLFENILKPM